MCSRLGDIAGKANFSMRILIPSRPVALLDEIFLRSCSTIFLVIGGITNRDGDVLIDLLFENSLSRVSNSVECILSDVVGTDMDVKYLLKAFAIFSGFDNCIPSTSMYAGDFFVRFVGATRFKTFYRIFT